MTVNRMSDDLQVTRRKALKVAFAGSGALLLAGAGTAAMAATNKAAQKAVSYRGTPNGKAQCDGCLQWQAPAACKVVAGTISPTGWCAIYSPKN